MTKQKSSATIVVVDDDPHVRRMLERLFRLEGY
jgi:CheY-like chemotaxis protein